MKNKFISALTLSVVALITVFSSCSIDDETGSTLPGKKPDIQLVSDANLGSIITNSEGFTLYFFTPDVASPTICEGECATVWPPYYKENPSLGTGLNAKDFAVVTRPDGKKNTTYKGWPLYTFIEDKKAGDTKGEKLENAWFVAKPDYTIMIGHTQLVGEDGKNYSNLYMPGNERFTPYFTSDRGVTLYTFSKDTENKNTFTSETDQVKNAVFPVYLGNSPLVIPSVLNKADFGSIKVFNNQQLTYKGRPIYTHKGDNNMMGSTKAISIPTPGVWPVATAANIAIQLPPAPSK